MAFGHFRATHRTTSFNLGGLFPFSAPSGMAAPGIFMGIDMDSGGAFTYDGWELYRAKILTGLIGMVIGKLGMRKSTYLKTYVYRSLAFDRYARVLDPKGEYRRLAERVGTEPVKLEPAGRLRLNPLDHRLLKGGLSQARLFQEQLTLLSAVCEAAMGPQVTLALDQRGAVEMAFRKAREDSGTDREATIPDVMKQLMSPNDTQAQKLGIPLDDLKRAARDPMLALRRMAEGELAGMFDGPTSPGIKLDHPLLVLDISEVYKSAAQAVVMVCAGAWMQQLLLQHPQARQLWVVDEGWALMRDLSTARWLLEATKFSRVFALSLWMVLHQFSDLQLAGGKDSEQASIGRTLLSHAQTKVIFGQDPSEVAATRDLMRLSKRECEVIARLRPSQSLQRIGENIRLRVEHVLTDEELAMTETDDAMGL